MIKYEKLFQEGEEVCGAPFAEFLTFFDSYDEPQARVLDIGCGQRRDALFIARLARLFQVVGKASEARLALAETFDWFGEGFNTHDLQEALALLVELREA